MQCTALFVFTVRRLVAIISIWLYVCLWSQGRMNHFCYLYSLMRSFFLFDIISCVYRACRRKTPHSVTVSSCGRLHLRMNCQYLCKICIYSVWTPPTTLLRRIKRKLHLDKDAEIESFKIFADSDVLWLRYEIHSPGPVLIHAWMVAAFITVHRKKHCFLWTVDIVGMDICFHSCALSHLVICK